jgi:hypothetical protein
MTEAQEKPAKRGEAAWIEQRDAVMKRNAETRKAGKKEREAYDKQRGDLRRAAEVRRSGELAKSSRNR